MRITTLHRVCFPSLAHGTSILLSTLTVSLLISEDIARADVAYPAKEKRRLAARKKKSAKSARGQWVIFAVLAALLAAVAVGTALNLPVHPRRIGVPVATPEPAVPKPIQRAVDLGSYGVTVTNHAGKIKALTIHPVAIMQGNGPWKELHPRQGQLDARIANPFMAFPDLAGITTSTAARSALKQQILQNIAPLLKSAEPGWKIIGIQLHPALQSPPPGDA
ncbi:MAG: hypothetical protein ACYDDP_09030 [Acidithiobacillus sp.]